MGEIVHTDMMTYKAAAEIMSREELRQTRSPNAQCSNDVREWRRRAPESRLVDLGIGYMYNGPSSRGPREPGDVRRDRGGR